MSGRLTARTVAAATVIAAAIRYSGMTAGPATRTSRDRLLAGDGLRALAALTVLGYHAALAVARYRYHGAYDPAFGRAAGSVFETLNAGLFVFFALSGYLLARPFAHAVVA